MLWLMYKLACNLFNSAVITTMRYGGGIDEQMTGTYRAY